MKFLKVMTIMALAFFVVNCSQDKDDAKIDPAKSLTIVSDTASQLKDIFAVATKGDRANMPQTTTRNFYPSASGVFEASDPRLTQSGTTPAMLAGTTKYNYTDSEGNRNQMIVTLLGNDIYSVELITFPANSISVNYMYEKINVKGNSWDPVNSNGDVDFTARNPYYVQYFDGKKENITVNSVGNGIIGTTAINLAYYDNIASYPGLSWNTTDANDYYSQSDFTFTFAGTKYGEGKRVYSEDKNSSGDVINSYTKEYSSRGFEIFWGLYSKKQNESYFSLFTAATGVEATSSIIDVGTGLLWFLDKDEQYIGYAAKTYNSTSGALTYNSKYTFYVDGFLGFKQYGVQVLDLSGTSVDMQGTLKVYKKWSKPNNAKFNNLPLADSTYATLNPVDYQLSQSEIDAAFGSPCTWTIRSVVIGTRSGESTQFEISTSDLLIPDKTGEGYLTYSATVVYDMYNKLFTITINDDNGKEIVQITNATVQADYIEGVATIDGKDYDIKLPVLGGGGIYKAVGDEVFSEL